MNFRPKPLTIILWLITLVFILFTATSFTHYTSVGLDNEVLTASGVQRNYYRLRWPGNGAFFIGSGSHLVPDLLKPSEQLDPAATFFRAEHDAYPEWQGRLIGYQIVEVAGENRQWWVGVPSFYVPILALIAIILAKRKS